MKRRVFLSSVIVSFLMPKSIFVNDKTNARLVIKNGWILKSEDI